MESILSFLRTLAQNNNREWFNDHKKNYQESLEMFREFAADLLTGIVRFDLTLGDLKAKDTIYRIYKDVRFSKDKLPYKTHFGCWMTKGGRKSTDAGYYFHLELINAPAMKERYERGGKEDMLKKGPAGFPKEFIHMEEVKYKHYIWSRHYSDDTILKSNFVHGVAEDFKGLYPLVSYLNHAMSFAGNY